MTSTESIATDDHDLDWLLENLKERTPGIRHVLVLSKDGLKLCFTSELDVDQADQLSVLGSGQSMVEFPGGVLLIVPAGEGAHLAVIADEDADVGLVGHSMNELVEQIGGYLTAPPRRHEASVS
jgi:predicted regulator of Ras-like GTPase activity (Roadblock/LC7/MglB family)